MFDGAFVVINEKPRGREIWLALLLQVEFNRARDCIRRATAKLALIVYRRAVGAQVDVRRERDTCRVRRFIYKVTLVGQIRFPSIPADSASSWFQFRELERHISSMKSDEITSNGRTLTHFSMQCQWFSDCFTAIISGGGAGRRQRKSAISDADIL
jgi:hypothetical protein